MKIKTLFSLITIVISLKLTGQNQIVYLNSSTHNTSGQYCGFWFYDQGGASGNYANNVDYWITFLGGAAPNTHVRLNFAQFDIKPDDTLYIYDGTSITSPLLGKHNNNYYPLTGSNSMVMATLNNPTGALTVRLKTNSTNVGAGWDAAVLCAPACQMITPQINFSLTHPTPHLEQDGNYYIDICEGQQITFAALGGGSSVFPQNDMLYHQDSTNCTFHWDFGDGSSSNGQIVTHNYSTIGGYNVYLSITDNNGCSSTQQFYIRVRISGEHIVNINPPGPLCVGQTITFSASYQTNSTVVTTTTISATETQMYNTVTYVPDGPNCPQQCYGTPVTFTSFPAGATIQSSSDIESICINMEHSFSGDLSFRIICPNGQSVVLDSYDHSGSSYLGQANETDCGACISNPPNCPQGTPWTYCWSEMYPQQGLLNTLDGQTSPVPATNLNNNTNYLTPENPLSGLIGCPLNGTWSIEICDNWGIDDGWVFWWSLTLHNPNLMSGWSYSVPVDFVSWTPTGGGTVSYINDTTATFTATQTGTYTVNVVVTDVFGCTHTGNFNLSIGGVNPPILGPDTTICEGQTITITAQGGNSYLWNTGQTTSTIVVSPTHTQGYIVTVTAANGCTAKDTIIVYVQQLPAPDAGPNTTVCGLTYTMQASLPISGGTTTWSLVSGPGTATFADIHSPFTAVTVSTPGQYVFQWKEVNGQCWGSDNVTITFIQQPIANAGPDASICGLDYTLNATQSVPGSNGFWSVVSPDNATFSNPNSFSTNVHGESWYGDYYFVFTEQNGQCVSRDTVKITFIPIPYASAGNDTIGCGQYAYLNADNIYQGFWQASTNVVFLPDYTNPDATVWLPYFPPNQSSITVSFIWNTSYNNCTSSDTVIITFVRPPHAEAGSTQSVCGTTTQLQADTLGSGIVSAYWTSSVPGIIINYSGSDPIPWNPTVNASNIPGFFINSKREVYFYWHATNGPGCSAVDSVLVTFYEIPTANAGYDTAVCDKSYTLQGQSSIENSTGQWFSPITNPGTANFVPPSSPNSFVSVGQYGTYTFIWTEMNAGNLTCLSKDTVKITFLVIPMPDAGLDFGVCDKFAYICATPGGGFSGHWSGPSGIAFYDGPPPTGQYNPAYADSPCTWVRWPSENDTITLYWTEFNGQCYGYDSVNIYFGRIYDAVILTNPTDTFVCGPGYANLSAQQPAVGNGYWIDNIPNTTFTPSPMANNNVVATIGQGSDSYYGVHCFQWITVNGACRDTSPPHCVKFIKQPVANAGGHYWPGLFGPNHEIKTDTVCGCAYQMSAQYSITGTSGIWYSLDPVNVYFVAGQGTSSTVANDSLYILGASCYTVFNPNKPYREFVWQENNQGLCFDSDTIRLYFAPRPNGNFTVTMPACRHDSSMIIAHTWPLPNHENYGIVQFLWNYPGGNLSPVISDPTTSDTIYVSWPTGDQHTVTLITVNKWGCLSGIVSRIVKEPDAFDPDKDINFATCGNCNGKVVLSPHYVEITQNGDTVTHYNYYTFNWLDTNSMNVVRENMCPGIYWVMVNGESISPDATPGTICHDSLRIVIPDTGYTIAQFDTLSIQQYQPAEYSIHLINTSINGKKFSWRIYDDKGNLIHVSNSKDLDYTFKDEGCYRIVLVSKSKEGCLDTFEYKYVCVEAVPLLEVPNVFTPNGDGMNDEFIIHGKSIEEFECKIYNRWGRKVYEWDDITKGWNGKIDGNKGEASPGIYYYLIKAKDKKGKDYDLNGYFYLLKEKK